VVRSEAPTDALSGRVRLGGDYVVAVRTVESVERPVPAALAPGEAVEAFEDPATVG